jgi:hypothetical protein
MLPVGFTFLDFFLPNRPRESGNQKMIQADSLFEGRLIQLPIQTFMNADIEFAAVMPLGRSRQWDFVAVLIH